MRSNLSISRTCLCLALVYSLIASDAQSQVPPDQARAGQWLQVQSITPGTKVEVRIPKKKIRGSLVSVTDSALVVSAKGSPVSLTRSEIKEVKVSSESARLRKGAINAAIGATGGVVTVAILDGALTDGDGMSGSAAVSLGAIGAIVGFVLGAAREAYRTVYKDR